MSTRQRSQYSRLSQEEQDAASERALEKEDQRKIRKQTMTHINNLFHSVVWVVLAGCVVYYGDMWRVVNHDSRVQHIPFKLALFCMTGVFSGLFYMAAWVTIGGTGVSILLRICFFYGIPLTEKIPVEDYNKYCPKVVQGIALAGVAAYVLFLVALWPVWGWVSIPMLSVLGIAGLFLPNLLPC